MKTVEEIKDIIIGVTVIVFIFGGLIAFIMFLNHKDQVRKEWNDKVNNCVLNENYRKDCKLILYRDVQIHNQQVQDNQQTSVMTGALVGGIVGASLKK